MLDVSGIYYSSAREPLQSRVSEYFYINKEVKALISFLFQKSK